MLSTHRIHGFDIDIARGTAAWQRLADPHFVAQWSALREACPWATAFQGPGFIRTWLECYRERMTPLVVSTRDAQGRLVGLLVLARSVDRTIVVAGGAQAEYQAWISRPELGDHFVAAAMLALQRDMPRQGLTFRYLPPGTPLAWAGSGNRHTLLRTHRRPLLRFGDCREITASLRKGSNRSKLKRLERLGPLQFQQVTAPAVFDRLFDRIIEFYDLRHGAIHGADDFANDPLKKPFHHAMMRVPGLLHVTALTVGEEIASAHLGVVSGNELQLGIIVHNPMMARHSPGKFHILMLCKMLHEQGLTQLDLTPGGDLYKERFANAWDDVHTLAVFRSESHRQPVAARWALKAQAKRWLQSTRIPPERAELLAHDALRLARRPISCARRGMAWVHSRRHTELYACSATPATKQYADMRQNCIADLLRYPRTDPYRSRQTFLSDALRRLEAGEYCYTACDDGRLVACAWLATGDLETLRQRIAPGMQIPDGSAIAHDFWCDPSADPDRWRPRLISRMLADAAGTGLYAVLDSRPSRYHADNQGVKYKRVATMAIDTRFGTVSTTTDMRPITPASPSDGASGCRLEPVAPATGKGEVAHV